MQRMKTRVRSTHFAAVAIAARLAGAALISMFAAACHSPVVWPSGGDPGSIPDPRPVSTGDYQVGAYYFPGWANPDKWKVLDSFPERRPLLGYYREGDPTVMDWQIKWAVEHGIAFFAFDWYWDQGRRQLEQALHDGYLRARFRPYLKFCLLWANHNPAGSSSEADLLSVLDYWIANYFHLPEYFTVDGKPVVIIFSPSRLRADMGTEAVAAAIRRMRAQAVAAGLPGLFLIGAVDDDPARVTALHAEGYDAGTGYNYPRAGMPDDGTRQAPYALAVEGYEAIWNSIAQAGVLEYVPVAEPGWDSRPWHGDAALVRTDRSPKRFRDMLRRARAFVDRHPIGSEKKLVLIEAWNEYGEGAAIEPHREWGFGYLDAIRLVFAPDAGPHRDFVPESLERP